MPYSLTNIIGSLINVLNDNNTTTSAYDISAGLEKRFTNITYGTPETPDVVRPCIRIRAEEKREEAVTIGRTGLRNIESDIRIVAITDIMAGNADAEAEIYKATSAIEFCIRNNLTLSNTVSDIKIPITTWTTGQKGNVFRQEGEINLETINYATN